MSSHGPQAILLDTLHLLSKPDRTLGEPIRSRDKLPLSSLFSHHAHSRARPGPLFAALTSGTIIGSLNPLLSSYPQLVPAGHKLTAKPSLVKVGEKLVTKSPVKVGVKRKAPDETPCQAKVRVKNSSALGDRFCPGPHVPNPLHFNFER